MSGLDCAGVGLGFPLGLSGRRKIDPDPRCIILGSEPYGLGVWLSFRFCSPFSEKVPEKKKTDLKTIPAREREKLDGA